MPQTLRHSGFSDRKFLTRSWMMNASPAGESLDAMGRGRGYVVYCRLCGLEQMAADRLGHTVTLFDRAMDHAVAARNVEGFSSPFGGGVVVWDCLATALEVAERLVQATTRSAVQVAVGMDAGQVTRVADVIGDNVVGRTINVAARLAALAEARGRVAASETLVTAAQEGLERARDGFFGELIRGRVKQTDVAYRLLLDRCFEQPEQFPEAPLETGLRPQ